MLNRLGNIAIPTPDWQSPFMVEYEFRTSEIRVFNGRERREAMRSRPRITVSFDVLLRAIETRTWLEDLAGRQDSVFTLPAWHRVSPIASVLNENIQIVAPPFWLTTGQRVVLSDGVTLEDTSVTAISGQTVTLAQAPVITPTSLYYAYQARHEAAVGVSAETDNLWTGNASYEVVPGTDLGAQATLTVADLDGIDVFLEKPNWRDRPELEFASDRRTLDFNRGVITVDNPVQFNTETTRWTFTRSTALEVEQLIAFFHRQKGKRGHFYAPTWRDDFRVTQVASTGATTLQIDGLEFFNAYSDTVVYRSIYVNGEVMKVTAVREAAGNTLVDLSTGLSADVTPEDAISWAPLSRFATDRLEVNWLTRETAEITFSIMAEPEAE